MEHFDGDSQNLARIFLHHSVNATQETECTPRAEESCKSGYKDKCIQIPSQKCVTEYTEKCDSVPFEEGGGARFTSHQTVGLFLSCRNHATCLSQTSTFSIVLFRVFVMLIQKGSRF